MSTKDSIQARLSAAGALVSEDPKVDSAVPYVARSYTHAAIEGRTIIRLLPEALVEAEDLAVSTMGLEAGTSTQVGYGPHVALGFPAWALVNDPANARHALALVKDLERAARRAKSKPGAAKEQIDELASRLGMSAPHFLPTFMEEVGRIFLRLDNKSYAAQFFGKARTAERVHNLKIDEDRHREVFLEFAFAGALTVKSLTEEARELKQRASAHDAYDLFRRLSLERVRGGLPPYGTMAKDLRSMAKAAGKNAAEEDKSVIAELITAPSVKQAATGFWTAYLKAITAVAAEDPGVKVALIDLFPDNVETGPWIDVLRQSGAVEHAKTAEIDLGSFLSKLIDHHHASSWRYPAVNPELQKLILEVGPLLVERSLSQNQTPSVFISTWRDLDLDILDVLAELKIEVKRHHQNRNSIDVGDHINREGNLRQLEFLAQEQQWEKYLMSSVVDALGSESQEYPQFRQRVASDTKVAKISAYSGLKNLLRKALEDSISSDLGTLYDYGNALNLAERLASPTGMKNYGDLIEKLPVPATATLLAKLFNVGIMDELGWDLYSDVRAEYEKTAAKQSVSVTVRWPEVVISNPVRATVLGRDGIILEHTVQIPTEFAMHKYSSPNYLWAGGELFVYWSPLDHEGYRAYKASDPHDTFAFGSGWLSGWSESLPVGESARTFGHRAFANTDRSFPQSRSERVNGDGQHFWIVPNRGYGNHSQDEPAEPWRELDVATGAIGRGSYPTFIADIAARPNHRVQSHDSAVLPLPDSFADTPLGFKAGTVGHCWYTNAAGEDVFERIDGVTVGPFTGAKASALRSHTTQLLSLPGDSELLLSAGTVFDPNSGDIMFLGSGGRFSHSPGTREQPHQSMRHNLRPRHAETSQRLRTVQAADVQKLIDVAVTSPFIKDYEYPVFSAAEKKVFDAIFPGAPIALMTGIMSMVVQAKSETEIHRDLLQLAGNRHKAVAASTDSEEEEEESSIDELPYSVFDSTPAIFHTLVQGNYGESYGYGNNINDRTLKRSLESILSVGSVFATPFEAAPTPTAEAGQPKKTGGFFKRLLGKVEAVAESVPAAAGSGSDSSSGSDKRVWTDDARWTGLFQQPAAIIGSVIDPSIHEADRSRLAWMLQTLAEAGLVNRYPELQTVRVSTRADRNLAPGQILADANGRVLLVAKAVQNSWSRDEAVQSYAAIRQGNPDYNKLGLNVTWVVEDDSSNYTAQQVQDVVELVRSTEIPKPEGQLERLIELTGMLPEEGILLLNALPESPGYSSTYDSDLAKSMGLTSASAKLASSGIDKYLKDARRQTIASLVPDNPADLFTTGVDVEKAAAHWLKSNGPKIVVDPDFLRSGYTDLKEVDNSIAILRWGLTADPELEPPARSSTKEQLLAIQWLAYNLPADSAERQHLGNKITQIREKFTTRESVLSLGEDFSNSFRTTHGLPPMPRGDQAHKSANPKTSKDYFGPFEVSYDFHSTWGDAAYDSIGVDLKKFTEADLEVLATINPESDRYSNVRILRAVFDPALNTWAQDISTENFQGPGALQNPLTSAPETVAAVQETLGVSQEAAALFLQILALPDPTNSKVQKWNGWTPAKRNKALAELSQAEVVVQAKRARAGRDYFLPGGWVTLPGASLPIEAWKSTLYGLPAGDKPALPLGLLFVNESLPRLFERAWAHYSSGDKPAYEELKTGRNR